MGEWTAFSVAERDILNSFFNTSVSIRIVAQRIQQINSSRSYKAIEREIYRMAEKHGWEKPSSIFYRRLRIGYADIEASNLNANFGLCLCWYIKVQGKDKFYWSSIKRHELRSTTQDERVVREFWECLRDEFDMLYGHYASRFDIPFMKTRALIHQHGEWIAKPGTKYLGDTWRISRDNLKLSSNRQEAVAESISPSEVLKNKIKPTLWNRAMAGDQKSLNYIKDHCKRDVIDNENIHQQLRYVERVTFRSL